MRVGQKYSSYDFNKGLSGAIALVFFCVLCWGSISLIFPRKASAAVTRRSSATNTEVTCPSDLTIGKPSGTTNGDVLIAHIAAFDIDGSAATTTPPAGWVTILEGGDVTLAEGLYYRIIDGSEGSDFVFDTPSTSEACIGGITAFVGVDLSQVIDGSGSALDSASDVVSPAIAPAVTTATPGAMVIASFFGYAFGGAPGFATVTGMSEEYDINMELTGDYAGFVVTMAADFATQALVGTTGSKTSAYDEGLGSGWSARTLALKPDGVESQDPPDVFMLLFWDGGDAPTDWSIVEEYNGLFPRGEEPENFGTTGGGGTHVPTVSGVAVAAAVTVDAPFERGTGIGNQRAQTAHTHTVNGSLTVGAASNGDQPAYRSLRLIKYNFGIPSSIPEDAIALFDDDPGMPGSDWTRYDDQDQRMVKIDSSVATGGSDTHTHLLTWPSLNSNANNAQMFTSGGDSATVPNHGHAAPADTTTATNGTSSADCDASPGCLPPYIEPIMAQADTSTAVPIGMIGMFDTDPGDGWDVRSESGDVFYQQFLRPDDTFNGASQGSATHTHVDASVDSAIGPTGSGHNLGGGGIIRAHTHQLTASFNSAEHLPQYVNVVFAEKNPLFTSNMLLFWDGGAAPAGWSIVGTFDDRFIRGEEAVNFGATGGQNGHQHTAIGATVGPPSAQMGGLLTGSASASTHTHGPPTITVNSAATGNIPAYRNLQLIRYNSGVPNIIPAGAIALFDSSPGIPGSGWTRVSAQDNSVVRVDTIAGGTGGADTHTHGMSFSGNLGAASGTTSPLCILFCSATAGAAHTHPMSGSSTSDASPNIPPYVQVLLAKADADTPTLSVGLTAMFDDEPGGGWVVRSNPDPDGGGPLEEGPYYRKFLRGGATYNDSDGLGALGHAHTGGSITSGASTNGGPNDNAGSGVAAASHTHLVTPIVSPYTTDPFFTGNNDYFLPPYFNVVVAEKVNFILDGYRWYEDPSPESQAVSSANEWSALNLPESDPIPTIPANYNPPDLGTELRLRIRLLINNNGLAAGEIQFKLQYKEGTDGNCTTGSWNDVGVASGSAPWRFANSTVPDGTQLTTSVLGSDILQRYVKSIAPGTNTNAVSIGQTMEYDFHIQHNGADGAKKYSFRLVEDTGILLSQYTECPTLSTKPRTENLLRHGNFFEGEVKQGFSWVD